MKIAIASPPLHQSLLEKIVTMETLVASGRNGGADIICFPESYFPGYPEIDFDIAKRSAEDIETALQAVCRIAAKNKIMIICPMDRCENNKWYNVAYVIAETGEVAGWQTKTQLDPSEDDWWEPGDTRQLFNCKGVLFGIVICHEGFRYPETVRWAAVNGAKIVFHPHLAYTANRTPLTEWYDKNNPYYEKAMSCRALENTIYYAGANYASEFSDAASCIIAPDGSMVAHAPYSETGVIVAEIDIEKATGLLAGRFKKERF